MKKRHWLGEVDFGYTSSFLSLLQLLAENCNSAFDIFKEQNIHDCFPDRMKTAFSMTTQLRQHYTVSVKIMMICDKNYEHNYI